MNDEDSDQFQSADEGLDTSPQLCEGAHITATHDAPEIAKSNPPRVSKKKASPGVAKKKSKKRKGTNNVQKSCADDTPKQLPDNEVPTSENCLRMPITLSPECPVGSDLYPPTELPAGSRSTDVQEPPQDTPLQKNDSTSLAKCKEAPVDPDCIGFMDSNHSTPTEIQLAPGDRRTSSGPTPKKAKSKSRTSVKKVKLNAMSMNDRAHEGTDSYISEEPSRSLVIANSTCAGDSDHTFSTQYEKGLLDPEAEEPSTCQTTIEPSPNLQSFAPSNVENEHTFKKPSSTNFGKSHEDSLHPSVCATGTSPGDPGLNLTTELPASFEHTNTMPRDIADLFKPPALDLEHLSSTAGSLLKGVGDRLNTIADALIQPLYDKGPENDEEVAARRQQRKQEEQAERKAISDAWSNVWDATWGTEDGWEVEDDPIIEPINDENITDPEQSVDTLASEIGGLSVGADKSDSTAPNMWNWSGVSSFAQQLTSSLQSTSLHLVQEGVGVLELIGKKTMSVIEENDPGFRQTKKLLQPAAFGDRPSLSQIIREAQEQDRRTPERGKNQRINSDKTGFLSELESQHALVHLEALDSVGERAMAQLHARLYSSAHPDFKMHQSKLNDIWSTLQMDNETTDNVTEGIDQSDEDDSSEPPQRLPDKHSKLWRHFKQSLDQLNCIYPGDRFLQLASDVWIDLPPNEELKNPQDLCRQAGRSLASLTSGLLEYLHKLAECTLVQNTDLHLDHLNLVNALERAVRSYLDLESHLCDEYIKLIKAASKPSSPNSSPDMRSPTVSTGQLVANLLLDCGNSQSYMKEATRLLVPVFQLAYAESNLSDL